MDTYMNTFLREFERNSLYVHIFWSENCSDKHAFYIQNIFHLGLKIFEIIKQKGIFALILSEGTEKTNAIKFILSLEIA
jgi:hypothetical protein